MAVSKIAVIALVAIISVPILLGYALNLNQVTVSEYDRNDDSVNVTQLLQNGTAYTTANGDIYQLNSKFTRDFDDVKIYPKYEQISSVKSSMPLTEGHIANYTGGDFPTLLATRDMYFISFDIAYSATSYVTVGVYRNGAITDTFNHVSYLLFERSTNTIYITCIYGPNSWTTYTDTDEHFEGFKFTLTGLSSLPIDYGLINRIGYGTNPYVDISAGFHFNRDSYNPSGYSWYINLPQKTSTALVSINLDSITDANYVFSLHDITFTKTTTAGVVSWTASRTNMGVTTTYDLYYDPSISNNTYQMFIDYSDQSEPSDDPSHPDPYRKYTRNVELRYIGGWQKLIGSANYYLTYTFEKTEYRQPANSYLNSIYVTGSPRSPTIRVDAAQFQAFQYQVIEDKTYDPSSFRSVPSTEVASIQKYGTQIIFGGNTYSVKDGNITLGSHSIPVEGLIFSSVPNDNGTYDNKIGNTLVSTTANPSTIQFVGKWAASVSTASMSQNTYTKTEWNVGSFAWDGMDQNFLIVGLVTCLGVFVALGIYARKSRSGGIIPLMIVVGGAAMVFFVML